MKFLLTCVLATAVALVAVAVAIGYFQQSRNLQAQLAATTKELQQTKSDLERAKREAGLSYHFHESFLRYFGARDAVDRAIARGGTDPDLLVRDVARSMKIERTK
jgi:uncharacterized protein (UPF0261 family)